MVRFPWIRGCGGWRCGALRNGLPLVAALIFISLGAPANSAASCRGALGMQSGAIPDNALTASSSYDPSSVGPHNARIHIDQYGGAWCPKNQIARDVYEWLDIDFGRLTVVTQVETQGRFGNGQGQEYAEGYLLEYSRSSKSKVHWIRYRNRTGSEVFPGNINTFTAVLRDVEPRIITRRLRIIPYSSHPRTVCMRVEIYGCRWTQGVHSYSMLQGERRGTEVDLYDFTYDGRTVGGYLSGGLGQLTDAEEGVANFRLDPQGVGKRGYEWIGWKNATDKTPPVEIMFEFDAVRNFTAVRFHSNNMFSKDVRVFRMAKLYFSISGHNYQPNPVVYEYMRDILMEFERHVIIPIPHRIGTRVLVHLYYDAKWILISEATFDSDVAAGDITLLKQSETLSARDLRNPGYGGQDGEATEEDNKIITTAEDEAEDKDSRQAKKSSAMDEQFIGIIIGALAALLLILLAIGLYVFIRHRRHKADTVLKTPQTQHVTLDLNDLRALNNPKVSNGNVYNSIATSDELDSDHEVAGVIGVMGVPCVPPSVGAVGRSSVPNGKVTQAEVPCVDNMYQLYDGIQGRKLPELPPCRMPGDSTDTGTVTSREYAVPDLSHIAQRVRHDPPPYPYGDISPTAPPLPPHPREGTGGIQGLTGGSLYAVPPGLTDHLSLQDLEVFEFPRDNLVFVEKLGEGQFGEVHLCEAVHISDLLHQPHLVARLGNSQSLLVAVKILRSNADDMQRASFLKEVKLLSRLKDPNIVSVLGMCTHGEPHCMIVEYMEHGDLHQYLRRHVSAEGTLARRKARQPTISYGCLIYMATQIASGMKYLENLNMVHRDLASRNCLVGYAYTIKVSDFGMSRSLYSSDYYRIEGKAVLPIRWMAWESVLLGKFSTKSDIWSFAVTLWEVLTLAHQQPFESLTDEAVIDNCGRYYRGEGGDVVLPQPPRCPREIYDLMCECWNRDETLRPAFREIHMFLLRKNMGYDPIEDFPL